MLVSSALLLGFLSTLAACHPIDPSQDATGLLLPPAGKVNGQACTGDNLSGNCTELIITDPNRCLKSINGELPFDRSINSIKITGNHSCAFFALETCIHPPGTNVMYVKAHHTVHSVPSIMKNSIRAYICGSAADTFSTAAINPTPAVGIEARGDAEAAGETLVAVLADVDDSAGHYPANDGRGATLYKKENLVGERAPEEKIAVPGDGFCANVASLVGDWSGHVVSWSIEPSYECTFFAAPDCNHNQYKITLGTKDSFVIVTTTRRTNLQGRVRSVQCKKI